MRLPHFLLFFLATLAPVVLASSGDIAPPFIDCLSTCNKQLCRPNSPLPLTFTLKLTRWTCVDDCKYRCMHMITDVAVKHHAPIQQYYGKWPFWRFAGMQEPASVLFSIFNFLAHLQGWKKIRQRVPDGHPMKTYYFAFALASMNAWVWSSVFHTRDLPSTEKLDYFSAALAIVYGLYYTVVRLFHLYPVDRYRLTTSTSTSASAPRSGPYLLWSTICTLAFFTHVAYLSLLPRFDYAYNMAFSLAVGMSHNLLWIAYSLPAPFRFVRRFPGEARGYRPRSAGKPAAFALLTTAATALELFDFPPWGRVIDAHSLWHLATVPIALFWYEFLIEDALEEGWRFRM